MVDAKVQWMAWQSGEQERQGGGGLGRSSRQTRVKTGWGIGYDRGQGARQKTRLTARWREGQEGIKPNGMRGQREGEGSRVE